jgi:hypothetical protein
MPRSVQPFDQDRLRGLYRSGLTQREIGDMLGWSHVTVARRLKQLREPIRNKGKKPRRELVVEGVDEIKGLAGWLRAAAGARSRVEMAPSTAVAIAALLEASVGHEQRSAT